MNSHIRPDYLLSLFDESFFNKKYFNNILLDLDESFIKKNENNKLIEPVKLEKNKNLRNLIKLLYKHYFESF